MISDSDGFENEDARKSMNCPDVKIGMTRQYWEQKFSSIIGSNDSCFLSFALDCNFWYYV